MKEKILSLENGQVLLLGCLEDDTLITFKIVRCFEYLVTITKANDKELSTELLHVDDPEEINELIDDIEFYGYQII